MEGLQIVLLGAPTSLASIMVIGPHHATATHVGGSSEVGQREHMVRLGIHRRCWSEFLCLDDHPAPPRQVGVCAPRADALDRHPPRRPRRWRPSGGPVAGANLSTFICRSHVVNDDFGKLAAIYIPA
jgi:hypothetical protein